MLKKRHNTVKVFIAMLAVLLLFVGFLVSINIKLEMKLYLLVSIAVITTVFLTWIAFSLTVGREAVVYDQPNNYPPEGINSMKAGCIIDGELSERDLVSGLYYMAVNGYVSINEYDKHQFEFVSLKYPENEDEALQLFYKSIFTNLPLGSSVKLVDAKDNLIKSIPVIRTKVVKSITKNKNREIADMTGKINGFRQSIYDTKGEALRQIVSKDENYLFEILPYAYAFAITSRLSSNFGPIKVNLPKWYKAYNLNENYDFDVVYYNAMLKYLPEEFKRVVFDELNFRIKVGLN